MSTVEGSQHLCLFRLTWQLGVNRRLSVKLCGDVNLFTAGVEIHTHPKSPLRPGCFIVNLRIWPLVLSCVRDL